MLKVVVAADDSSIECYVGKRKVLLQFEEQVNLFQLLYQRLIANVVVWEIDEHSWYIDLKEPYATFVYRWLKAIEMGEVVEQMITNSELLSYIHGEA